MAEKVTAEWGRREGFLAKSGEGRRVLAEVVNGRWIPTTLTGKEVRAALEGTEGEGGGGRVGEGLKALMTRWAEETRRVKSEVDAASSDPRRAASASAEGQLTQCSAAQRGLHQGIAQLQVGMREERRLVEEKTAADRAAPAKAFFALYGRKRRGGDVMEVEAGNSDRPLSPLPQLGELVWEDKEEVELKENADVEAVGLQTPVKVGGGGSQLQSPPAYMGGGGLLDDSLPHCDD